MTCRDGATVTFRAAFLGHDICELLSVVKCTPDPHPVRWVSLQCVASPLMFWEHPFPGMYREADP